jgi:outer membrane receptor for ferrienterochelin and colicins
MYYTKYGSVIVFFCFLIILNTSLSAQIDTTGVNRLFEMDFSDLMNQKVVTASKYMQSAAEAASSIGVITSDEIKQYGYLTLGEALNNQRGMFLSNDKNYLYVGSRGLSRPTDYNNRIVVMIDGHIMNEVVYGSGAMGNDLGLNLDNVDRIEIIRGPGASVYGSGAMLNIINLIMKKGADIDGIAVSAATGSFGKNDLSLTYGKKVKKTDIFLSGIGGNYKGEDYYFSELDAPATNYGRSVGMDWEKYAGIHGGITNNNFKLFGGFVSRSKGIPTGAFNTDLTGKVETTDDRSFLEASYRKELKKNSSLLFRSYYDDYSYRGSYPEGGLNYFDASVGRWIGAEIQYYLEAGKRNIITAGLEYKQIFHADYREWADDTTYFSKNFPFSFFSVYAQDQIMLIKNLNLSAGLRYDQYSVFGQSASPRLALVYKYSEASSLKLLYSQAFRIPNIYESFYESHNSSKKNPDIKPEKIRSAELVWSHKLSKSLFGSFSLYRFTALNLIDQILDESDALTTFRNIGKATGNGVEYELKYIQNSKKNQAFLNFTLQKTVDANTKNVLSNSPEFMIKSGFVLAVTNYFNVAPEFFYETGRKTLQGNETNDVFLINLGINSVMFLKYFEASLKARNLLNTTYYVPGGNEHLQDALVQDSRSLYFKLTAHF